MGLSILLLVATHLLHARGEGSVVVLDLGTGFPGSRPTNVTAIGKGVVFSASTSEVGRELFASDGTYEGTRLVADLNPGAADSTPKSFVRLGEYVYFSASAPSGIGIFETDGSGAALIATGVTSLLGSVGGGRLLAIREGVDGRLVAIDPRSGGEDEVFRSPGLHVVDFGGDGRLRVLRVWAGGGPPVGVVTDGSAKGTFQLPALPRGQVFPFLGQVVFGMEDRRIALTNGRQSRFIGIPGGIAGPIVGVAGRLVFFDGYFGGRYRLWSLDNRDRLTELNGNVSHSGQPNFPSRETGEVNGRFFFWGGPHSGPFEGEPHGTDGARVELVADLISGPPVYCLPVPYICGGASLPRDLTPIRRESYFIGGGQEGMRVWRTDGTAEGTVPVTDAFPLLRELVAASSGLFVAMDELAFVPLRMGEPVRTAIEQCRVADGIIAPGASATFEVEQHCGLPAGVYSVDLTLGGSSAGRVASAVRLAPSGAVPPASSTLLFWKRTTSTHTVSVGPRGINVWNEGPGAVQISLDVTAYEAAADSR